MAINFRQIFSRTKKSSFQQALEKIIGLKINDISLYETALTHKSVSRILKGGHKINNERLEYLGDAVLETIVSDYLYKNFPDKNEGDLTQMRSMLVKRTTLDEIGNRMGYEKLIKTIDKTGNNHLLGNTYEALVGAVYLDSGYRKCKVFVAQTFEKNINLKRLLSQNYNFKSELLQWCQKHKYDITFELVHQEPAGNNDFIFYTQVSINDVPMGTGEGKTKKKSEQNASKEAFDRLKANNFSLSTIQPLSE